VPKRENFSLAFFFHKANPPGYVTCGLGKKIEFLSNDPCFRLFFGFLPHTECAVNQKKFEDRPKLKVDGGCF
jgi:hypothetical protein